MNGYSYRRLEDSEIPSSLALAVGLDNDTPGLVMVDLVIPQYQGAYRFTAQQFEQFAYAVTDAAKMSKTFAIMVHCVIGALHDEDPDFAKRVWKKVTEYMYEYAADAGGENVEITELEEENVPFSELDHELDEDDFPDFGL